MHMALPAVLIPKKTTLMEQAVPAAVALLLIIVGGMAIPVTHPVDISSGAITPSVVAPGDQVKVEWRQDWRYLCPLSFTREFTGADTYKKTSQRFEFQPPTKTGVHTYSGDVTVPDLPAGQAWYHSIIEPHCWIDAIWQRKYLTPEIPILVVAKTPTGPR